MPIISKLEIYGVFLLLIALGMGAAYFKGKHEGMAEVQAKFDLFTAQVKAEGEKARADALAKEKTYADQINAANTGRDRALASLRVEQARPRGGFVPIPAAGSGGDSKICYERAALDAALRKLDTGVSQIVGSGDQAIIDAAALIKAWPK